MTKPVILTGLRANNDLHIGNYFGALLPIIDMATKHADEFEINLFVPDLHSFTTPIDHKDLFQQTLHNLKLFVAAGLPLDKDSIHIYRQSFVHAHSELTWILDCFVNTGVLRRMTQFKDKSANAGEEKVSMGLFNYPVLMAADILLYGAKFVPVGDDQTQHLEFTRDIAKAMNVALFNRFPGNEVLFEKDRIPEPVAKQHEFFGKDQGLRIRDLMDPTKKMSKSDDTGKGVIFLGDLPDEAAKKIMSATTDSMASIHYDWQEQPGVSNLLEILALLTGRPQEDIVNEWEGKTSYGDLKLAAANAVKSFLVDFQSKLSHVDEHALMAKLEQDEKVMNEIANTTLRRVQQAVGLRS